MSTSDDSSPTDNGVTQAEVYDNLKRIGELEDEKRRIQEEIWNRTEQLRGVVKHIDRGSILYKILEFGLVRLDANGRDLKRKKKDVHKEWAESSYEGVEKEVSPEVAVVDQVV